MTMTFRCPNGHRVTRGGTMTNVTVVGSAGMNVAVTCDVCGTRFDAAPGGGTFSADASTGGEFRRVADFVRSTSTDDLRRLLEELTRARAESSAAKAQEALSKAGLSAYERRMELWTFLAVLIGVISIVISLRQSGSQPTTPEITQIINQCVSIEVKKPKDGPIEIALPEVQMTTQRKIGRNELCPCASGKKYKRCHGAPPSTRE